MKGEFKLTPKELENVVQAAMDARDEKLLHRIEVLEHALDMLGKQVLRHTDQPANHGKAWSHNDSNQLYYLFSNWALHMSNRFGRTKDSIRIKLLRTLKEEYPTEWMLANKE